MKLVAVVIALAACGGANSNVAVKGGELDVARLAGDWQGNYKGTESGRSGPISMSLQLGRHTADGTVLMGGATPLNIQFVAIENNKVSGKIAPYTDPQCNCQVATEFVGTLENGVIDGTFTTTLVGKDTEQHGVWQVKKKTE